MPQANQKENVQTARRTLSAMQTGLNRQPVTPRFGRVGNPLRIGNGPTHTDHAKQATGTLDLGGLIIDPGKRRAVIGGREIYLTSAEFDLLWLLAQHRGEVVHRDRIFAELRGIEYNGLDRSMDLRVARLRKKLGDNGQAPRTIKSIRSIGYLLVTDLPVE